MNRLRSGKSWLLVVAAVALLCAGALVACSSVDEESQQNLQPTVPTPGDPPDIDLGDMSLSPSAFDLTVGGGKTGAGVYFYIDLAGGKPPFTWTNTWTQMGHVTPITDPALGYANRARYSVKDFRGTGEDTINVRDRSGATVSATFTKTIEPALEPTAPVITPAAATIVSGSSISLIATGGGKSFSWTTSLPPPAAGFNQGPPISQDFASSKRVTFFTEAFTGTVARVATISVLSGGKLGTATITINPTGP